MGNIGDTANHILHRVGSAMNGNGRILRLSLLFSERELRVQQSGLSDIISVRGEPRDLSLFARVAVERDALFIVVDLDGMEVPPQRGTVQTLVFLHAN